MKITVTEDGDKARFQIEGEIDERGAEELKSRFRGLSHSSLKEATFDFSKVKYIGSAGIGKLLLFYKDLAGRGGSLRVENAPESIYNLFLELKLNTIFTISR